MVRVIAPIKKMKTLKMTVMFVMASLTCCLLIKIDVLDLKKLLTPLEMKSLLTGVMSGFNLMNRWVFAMLSLN